MKQKNVLMAIAVKSESLKSEIESCFGKAEYFFIADMDKKKYEFRKNPGSCIKENSGKKAAHFLLQLGVRCVISYNFGATVKNIFDRNNVQIVMLSDKYKYLNEIKWTSKFKSEQLIK